MNELQIFNYNGNEVRTIQKDGEPWWVLKDVCDVLNIENHKDLPKRLEDDEVGRFDLPHPQSRNCFVSTKAAYTTSFSAVISQKQSLSASGLHLRYCHLSASMGHT